MHGRVNVSILYVLMFCDIGSDGMDSTVLKSSRVGQLLKRLKELVWNSASGTARPEFEFANLTRLYSSDFKRGMRARS